MTKAGHGVDFIYNHHFTCTRGAEFFIDGEIRFPEEALVRVPKGQVRADGSYRTKFGPTVAHNGVIYENSNQNVRLAMRRLTAVRQADHAKECQYALNQVAFMDSHQHVIEQLRNNYNPYFTEYKGMVVEAAEHHDDAHDKRMLRVQAWKDLTDGNRMHYTDRLWLKTVTYKMKKNEWAKPGSLPRMIGDLKVPASLQGFRVTSFLKEAMNDCKFLYGGGMIMFCAKPTFEQLSYVFAELHSPGLRFFFVFFSDDACYAVHTDSGVRRFNLDISSCDASHGPALFENYPKLTEGVAREDLEVLVDQCKLPIRIYDLADTSHKRYVELQPKVPKLYSGSTMTTTLNNFANIMIAVSTAESKATQPDEIIAAAAAVGYLITIDEAIVFEDIQFLKHSPVIDITGAWRPVLNIGVLLRLSGTTYGDLPGRGDLKTRGREFQHALLQGAYPHTNFPLIVNMRKACGTTTNVQAVKQIEKRFAYKNYGLEKETFTFHSADIYRRYRLNVSESEHLDDVLGNANYGEHFCSPAADLILTKDYGLRTLQHP